MKTVFLKHTTQQVFSSKRSWTAQGWKIVDEAGEDVQPWVGTAGEAREIANRLGMNLIEGRL
jgi:hypothetical protein